MKLTALTVTALLLPVALTACATAPEPIPEAIVITPEIVRTCAPISALQRIVVPAETKVQYAITMIDNPPYDPIESKVKQTRVVKPAEIIYVSSDGRQVFDICETVELGQTGPGVGELIPS